MFFGIRERRKVEEWLVLFVIKYITVNQLDQSSA